MTHPSPPSHVYLLAHRSANLIKIGKANSIINRISSLGRSDFDLRRSIGLMVESERQALDLERFLHTAFKASRVPHQEVLKVINQSSGLTEWFDADCLDRAQGLLAHIKDIVPFNRVDVVFPATPVSSLSRADRVERRNKAQEAEQLNIATNNDHCLNKCQEAITRLLEITDFMGVHSKSLDSFNVFFSSKSAGVELRPSNLLGELVAYGRFHTYGGSIGVIGSYSYRDGRGYFNVQRPLIQSSSGHCGQEIEIHFDVILDLFRKLPDQLDLSFYQENDDFWT